MSYCAAQPRRLRLVFPIAQVTSMSLVAPNPQPTCAFWVRTPSARLAMRVAVTGFCGATPERTDYLRTFDPSTTGRGLANWNITPCIDNTGEGGAMQPPWSVPMTLQPVFVDSAGVALNRPLPDGWEYQGPAQLFRVACNVNIVQTTSERPTVFADVTWEPGVGGDIDDAQLTRLFSMCKAWADSVKSIVGFGQA